MNFIKSWNRPPAQSHVFCNFFIVSSSSTFSWFSTGSKSKKMLKTIVDRKSQKPQKPIIQKTSILALFDPPYIGQYVPVSAMELKWSFLRGPAHKIEKRPFFAKKNEKWRSGRKGLKLRLALQSSSVPPLVRPIPRELWSPVCDSKTQINKADKTLFITSKFSLQNG